MRLWGADWEAEAPQGCPTGILVNVVTVLCGPGPAWAHAPERLSSCAWCGLWRKHAPRAYCYRQDEGRVFCVCVKGGGTIKQGGSWLGTDLAAKTAVWAVGKTTSVCRASSEFVCAWCPPPIHHGLWIQLQAILWSIIRVWLHPVCVAARI